MPATMQEIGGHVGHAAEKKYGVQPKSANHSPLMAARMKTGTGGEIPNFCPFGCTDEHLDEHGYCYHLIGFTVGDTVVDGAHKPGKFFERLGQADADGHRRMLIEYQVVKGKSRPVLERLNPALHRTERITSNHRVYENVAAPADVLERPDEPDDLTDDELDALTNPENADGR